MATGDHRIQLHVDGRPAEVTDSGTTSLLDALREQLGRRGVKDGCSPQGQCGCCTVLVDGAPRVACVTPVRRVAGRTITTIDGLPAAGRWAEAFCATGASQCGFCTPGIIVRLAALEAAGAGPSDSSRAERDLLAHLCRCTGWRTILDAWRLAAGSGPLAGEASRDLGAAARRATIEGRTPQRVDPGVALGRAGFADDTAPAGSLVAVPRADGTFVVGETLAEARALAGKVQGRRTTAEPTRPLALPAGEWDVTLRTAWVEPAYLELDASWCEPGGEPATPLVNGGAFGGKAAGAAVDVRALARRLADEHGRAVRVVLSREDAVRWGPKRPPIAGGIRRDGTGVLRVAATPGIESAIIAAAPRLAVEQCELVGPPTSAALRAAGWAEAAVLRASIAPGSEPGAPVTITGPEGGRATAVIEPDGTVRVGVAAGDPLDDVVLRSYCTGAAHMALGVVRSEGLHVDDSGAVHDLTIRSFGVLRSVDTPPIAVDIEEGFGSPVNVSDAVFAAVAAADWIRQGCPPEWPTGAA